MARVTVRAFAALREHIPQPREADADDVGQLLAQLRSELDEAFAERLERSSVVVGDDVADAATPLEDGDEVVLLPPFAGG